jgi:flagellar biosynthetic protein FlhB
MRMRRRQEPGGQHLFIIAGATLILSTFSGSIGGGILTPLRNLIANAGQLRADGAALLALGNTLGYAVLGAIGVPLLMLMIAAIAGNMIQHRLVWSSESLTPKFSKISPGAGLKRIFGKQAVANFLKGVFKLIALGAVMMAVLWPERDRLESFLRFDPSAIMGVTTNLTLQLMGAVVAMLAAVAIATTSSSIANGLSGRKCRCRRSRTNTSSPKATPTSRAGSGSCGSSR